MTATVARFPSNEHTISRGLPPTQITTTRTRPRFVEDLIPYILESSNHFWTRDYVRLVRVSRAWVGPIRKRLYQHPTLYTFKSCTLLARSLNTNPALITLIHGLHLFPSVSNSDGGRITHADTAGLRRLLAVPNLEEFSLGGDLAISAQRFLMSLACPHSIKRLTIDGSVDFNFHSSRGPHRRASLEWDSGLAVRFRNLKELELTDLELEIIPPAARCAIPLESVQLYCVSLTGGFIERLAVGAWSRLRKLNVTTRSGSEYNEQIRFLLSACAETLESFEYECQNQDSAEGFFDSDASVKFPALRTIKLRGIPFTPDILLDFHRRCTALTDLTVQGRNILVTTGEWTDMIQNGSWPNLRNLTVPGGTGPPFEYWSQSMGKPIVEACRRRGLHVECRCISDEQHAIIQRTTELEANDWEDE